MSKQPGTTGIPSIIRETDQLVAVDVLGRVHVGVVARSVTLCPAQIPVDALPATPGRPVTCLACLDAYVALMGPAA